MSQRPFWAVVLYLRIIIRRDSGVTATYSSLRDQCMLRFKLTGTRIHTVEFLYVAVRG